ncbi:MAG: hypothetical protein ACREA3_10005 [Nitrosotalea sp.]
MKTLHLSFIMFTIIILLSFGLQPARADNVSGIYIQNIIVQPSTVKVGDTFTVTTTLVNNSTVPITLDGGTCSTEATQASFVTVMFDNHAKIKEKNMNCAGAGVFQILNSGKNIIEISPDYTTTYVATESGTANVTVSFAYHVKNQTDPTQPDISQTISKSLLFTILDNNTGTKTITETVLSPLQQFKSGTPASDVKCNDGLQLILRTEDGSPACVSSNTAQILIVRGWAKNTTGISGLANPPVGLYNLALSAKPIILGIPFYINAVVTNYQSEPITYYRGCVSPLSVSFDNIQASTNSIHCLAISKYTLGPNQSVPIQSDIIETFYNATGPNATTNAEIKFSYEIDGKQASMFTSMQIPIQAAIMIDCTGRVVIHMAQIDKTVNVQKAIDLAYTSPEFVSKVKQYGNVSYYGFYNDWLSSESCHTYWYGTEVMFTTNEKNGSRNIQVSEDINLTKVIKVSDFQASTTK